MMNISPEKMSQYRATAQKRLRLAESANAERLTRARFVAEQAARLLKEQYCVERVVVFGSVAHPQRFHAHSDIDLAAWGLAEQSYYRVVGELQGLDPDFGIDLVRGEDVSEPLRHTIEQESLPL